MSELAGSTLKFINHEAMPHTQNHFEPDLALLESENSPPIAAGYTFMSMTISRPNAAHDVHSNPGFTVTLDQLRPLMKRAPAALTPIHPEISLPATKGQFGDRVRHAMGRARRIIREAPLKGFVAAQNKLTGFGEHSDKRTAVSIVAGTLALGYLALQAKGLVEHGHVHEVVSAAPVPSPKHTDALNHVHSLRTGTAPHEHFQAVHHQPKLAHHHLNSVMVKSGSGDTISHEATQNLHRTGHTYISAAAQNHEMLRIMQLNHISLQEALKLGSTGDVKLKLY